MTNRERIETILRGGTPDRMPFTIFPSLLNRSFYEKEFRNKGLGFVGSHSTITVARTNITETVEKFDGGVKTIYRTPVGDVNTIVQIRKGASTSGNVAQDFMIKSEADYPAVIHIIDNTTFTLDESGEALAHFCIGDEGIIHAWTGEPPYMEAQYYLGLENWVYAQEDEPELFAALLAALERMQERNMALVAQSNMPVLNLANLAGTFSADAFETYMLPHIQKYSKLLRARGKYTTLHADASNVREYAHLVPKMGINIVEAFTPPPFGNLSLGKAREAWGEDVCIWINFPETVFYEGYENVRRYTKELLLEDPGPNKMICMTEMGFTGTTMDTVQTFIDGFHAVLDAVAEFGNYK